MKCKIVIDTSVFVSAIIGPNGPARALIRKCFEGEYLPVMGNALFSEYEDVRKRAEISAKSKLSEAENDELAFSFYSLCEWITIYYLWRPNLKDEQDNHLIELAIAANAPIIATNNVKDFVNAQLSFPELSILKPEQVLHGE